jgi:hypothetical protein|tara:strand:+ start:1219 stop:1389 length:171 start_codon:yes stop_codon:yes gene_type:complete
MKESLLQPTRTAKNGSRLSVKALEEFEISGDQKTKKVRQQKYLERVEKRRQEILNG